MRYLAIIPALLSAAALILSFLCLFAGSKKGFMEDYAVVTLNTSQIGQSLFNTSESSDNPVESFFDDISNTIESEIEDAVTSVARDLGLHHFYSAHLLNFCEGYYVPGPVANATVDKSEIHKNVTDCSNQTAMYHFDPRDTLQRELDASGHSEINVADLDWPSEIDDGLQTLHVASSAAFVLYCIAIALVGVAFLLALVSFFFEGRLSAFANVMTESLAFLVMGIASAIATAIAVKAEEVINKYGNEIGVSANKGSKFLVITWVATGLMLVASLVWCFVCVAGRKQYKGPSRNYMGEKYT